MFNQPGGRGVLFALLAVVFAWQALSGRPTSAVAVIRVPADLPTIQDAILASNDGDIVQVSAGTYVENVRFFGRDITVESESGAFMTIIDGGGSGSVVTFDGGESRDAVLTGFTIRNGSASFGGGIQISGSRPTISQNRIASNFASSTGGGIHIRSGAPLITQNVILGNQAICDCLGASGGGIASFTFERPEISRNVIAFNQAPRGTGGGVSMKGYGLIEANLITDNEAFSYGGGIVASEAITIVNNLISRNHGAPGSGVYLEGVVGYQTSLVNNTIAENENRAFEDPAPAAVFVYGSDPTRVEIANNVVVESDGEAGISCWAEEGVSNAPVLTANDVFTPAGISYLGLCQDQTGSNGNISVDPSFAGLFDFHLSAQSQLIDAGSDAVAGAPSEDYAGDPRPQDGDGDQIARIDIGAYEHQPILQPAPSPVGGIVEVTRTAQGPTGLPWALAVIIVFGALAVVGGLGRMIQSRGHH